MKKYILLLLASCSVSFAQDLKCSDFKTGRFRYADSSTVITRTETHQTEVNPDKGYEIYGYIDWISECEYVLTWGKKTYVNPPKTKERNMAGEEIHVKIIKIEGNTMTYSAKFDGIEVTGDLIKIIDN